MREHEREQEYIADGFFLMNKLQRWRKWVVLIHAVRGRGDHSVMRFMIRRWQERKNERQLARDTLLRMFRVSAHWQKHAALQTWQQEAKAAYALRFWYDYLKKKYFTQWSVLLRLRDTFATMGVGLNRTTVMRRSFRTWRQWRMRQRMGRVSWEQCLHHWQHRWLGLGFRAWKERLEQWRWADVFERSTLGNIMQKMMKRLCFERLAKCALLWRAMERISRVNDAGRLFVGLHQWRDNGRRMRREQLLLRIMHRCCKLGDMLSLWLSFKDWKEGRVWNEMTTIVEAKDATSTKCRCTVSRRCNLCTRKLYRRTVRHVGATKAHPQFALLTEDPLAGPSIDASIDAQPSGMMAADSTEDRDSRSTCHTRSGRSGGEDQGVGRFESVLATARGGRDHGNKPMNKPIVEYGPSWDPILGRERLDESFVLLDELQERADDLDGWAASRNGAPPYRSSRTYTNRVVGGEVPQDMPLDRMSAGQLKLTPECRYLQLGGYPQ
jgi:hypothetical protein